MGDGPRLLATEGHFSAWWYGHGYIQIEDDRVTAQGASVAATREEFSHLVDLVRGIQDRLDAAIVCQHGKRWGEWCEPCCGLVDGPPVWTEVEP